MDFDSNLARQGYFVVLNQLNKQFYSRVDKCRSISLHDVFINGYKSDSPTYLWFCQSNSIATYESNAERNRE